MVFKRWTVMTGGALALAGSLCFVGLGAREAAAEPLRLAATHQRLTTNSNQDGTATVTLAVTLTNTGSVAAEDVRLILLKGPRLPVMPGENVLRVGALAAGRTVTLSWPITVLAPVAAIHYGLPLMVIHAEGIAVDGTTPLGTGVLSRAVPKASSAGSATEPANTDAAIARCRSTARVSVDSAGNQGNNGSYYPAISADGRFVAFESDADNLVPGDTNAAGDVFVHDCKTAVTERVSVDSAGNQDNDYSAESAISADGRFVAFSSYSDNLVPGDTNAAGDVFVHNRKTGATERVSVDSAGNQGNSHSYLPAISADGRFVAFSSYADNLVPGDTNYRSDVFVHDRKTGITERVSVDSVGNQAEGFLADSSYPAISADGRFVAFSSWAGNLVPGDTNSSYDVFVHDRKTGATERVSVDIAGNQVNAGSSYPAISADGRFVAYSSYADNLVPADTNGTYDVFVHDRKTGITEGVSVDSAGNQGNAYSLSPAISADGRFVAFDSGANNLVPGDTNGWIDVFVRDRKTGATERVSVDSADNQGNNYSLSPAISADGRFVAYSSYADNLVPGDTNSDYDVFVRDRKPKIADRADLAGE